MGFSKLKELNLARNSLSNFGFDNHAASPDSCWPNWASAFPALRSLTLQGCTTLQKLHPQAFSVSNLDLRGCPNLTAAPVLPRQAVCWENTSRDASAACACGQWPVCLYRSGLWTSMPNMSGMECASPVAIDLNTGQTHGGVLVSPQTFNPQVLCRCPYDLLPTSTGCMPKGVTDTGVEGDLPDTLMLVIIISASMVLILSIAWLLCMFDFGRHQRVDEQYHGKCENECSKEDHATITLTQSGATEELFAGMGLTEIVEQGLKEEWVIHAESLELGEIIGKGAFGEVHKALLLGSTEVALKVSHHKSKLVETHMRALLNEVRVLRRIRHPNIVLFSGATVLWRNSEPVFCMVLEWIDGGDLRHYASRRRRMVRLVVLVNSR